MGHTHLQRSTHALVIAFKGVQNSSVLGPESPVSVKKSQVLSVNQRINVHLKLAVSLGIFHTGEGNSVNC